MLKVTVLFHRLSTSLILLCLLLTSCANSGLGESLQTSLAADPKLKDTAVDEQAIAPTPSPTEIPDSQAELPTAFPTEIPQYPAAVLQSVNESDRATQWASADSSDRVFAFYQQQFQTNGWKLEESPLSTTQGTLVASRDDLRVTVTVQPKLDPSNTAPTANPVVGTDFTIQYQQGSSSVGAALSPTPSPTESTPTPQEAFLGLSGSSDETAPPSQPAVTLPPNSFTDIDKAPKELQPYITALAQLGVLDLLAGSKEKASVNNFAPNKPISRREYVRWLFAANNRLYRDRLAQQIRPAAGSSQPAFRDVPVGDRDFAAIQGLAEAGILSSALSGDLAAVTFRPDAQLSRENLLLWKVPMDTRQPLPTASLDVLKQTWGFQDAARIDPKAQRAVLADYQNGDQSNIRRAFGYTTIFQPKKAVTRAEAAATLGYFGYQGDGISAQEALKTEE
ncbi:S-layer homology domain-containing protein [Leptolyngbya sp. Cla-17]|uniref:S-layer homology domain-containing protein n=1 Tax=Leptolyngbya sp. Cla-17 TaxID=2803751 RepID=UPI0018D92E80|nr:S-layer homology domain-containing protein [Leptolyngbya sp. Cla-17]